MTRLLHTPEEAAEMLNVGRSRVYDLIRTGALKSVTIGRSRRVSHEALTDFVASLSADGSTV